MSIAARSTEFAFPDPFGASADPRRYVPRAATERALAELLEVVREGRSALLLGIPGVGKTLLLRLLGRRLAPEIRSVYLPYAALPPAALCAWALRVLELPASYDPTGAILAQARRPRPEGQGLVLLVDDAEVLPEETARELGRIARESQGALRFVAAAERLATARLTDAFGEVATVSLVEPMSEDETTSYVAAHLENAELPEAAIEAFDPGTLGTLFARAGGVPSRVNAEASALLRDTLLRPLGGAPLRSAPPPATDREVVALERAAGRLALAHSEAADSGELEDPALERAMGRLVIAEVDAERPAAASAADPASPTRRSRRGSPAAPLVVFGVCFGVGTAAGLWLGRGGPSPRPITPLERVQPAVAAPPPEAAPAPSPPAPAPVVVRVQINSTPWASIRIDGQEIGETPLAGVPVEAGPHRFEATLPDGQVLERVVEIDATNRFVVFP